MGVTAVAESAGGGTPAAARTPLGGPAVRVWRQLRAPGRTRVGLALFAVVVAMTLGADFLAPYPPDEILDAVALKSQPPSPAHPFGTDPYSRDVLSRVLVGSRVTLGVALLAAAITMVVGTACGALAALAGPRTDAAMMRLVDAMLSVPRVLLLFTLVALWGQVSVVLLVLFLGLTSWFGVSRIVRAQVRALRDREFVVAARALGGTTLGVFFRHLLPNVAAPLLVAGTLAVRNVILLEAGLSFLGAGVPHPLASWGSVIRDGADQVATHWWIALFPGLAIVVTVIALDAFADGLRQALDPRQLPRP